MLYPRRNALALQSTNAGRIAAVVNGRGGIVTVIWQEFCHRTAVCGPISDEFPFMADEWDGNSGEEWSKSSESSMGEAE
jgi:hypothetical protein